MVEIKLYVITHGIQISKYVGLDSFKELIYVGNNKPNEKKEFVTDDTFEGNIAKRNSYYSELTGIYWILKNPDEHNIIGVEHYRRFFLRNHFGIKYYKTLRDKSISKLLKKYDVILPKKDSLGLSMYESYSKGAIRNDIDVLIDILSEKCSHQMKEILKVLFNNKIYHHNMLITNKQTFMNYHDWLFDILFELERRITDLDKRDNYNKRVFGFLSERLLTIYFIINKFKIKEVPIITIDSNLPPIINSFLQSSVFNIRKLKNLILFKE